MSHELYSADDENGVLSCMLQAPDQCVPLALEGLPMGIEAFSSSRGMVFDGLLSCASEGGGVTIAELTTTLRDRGELAKVGGAAGLVEILRHAPSPATMGHYVRQVVRYWQRREMRRIAAVLAKEAANLEVPEVETIDAASGALERVRGVDLRKGLIPVQPLLMEAIEAAQEIYNRRGKLLAGLATGFVDIDRTLLGMKGGQLIVIAARPSMGKTALLMSIAENLAMGVQYADFRQEPVPIAVFSLEMGSLNLTQRMLWGRAGINLVRMRDGMLTRDALPRLATSAEQLSTAQIYLDDQAALSISECAARVTMAVKRWKIRAVVIDYLQLMRSGVKEAGKSRQLEIGIVTRGLKKLAKDLGIPVIVAAQLNRNPDQRTGQNSGIPKMSDLRESGDIEQDADVVGLLYRPDYGKKNKGGGAPGSDDDDDDDDNPNPRHVSATAPAPGGMTVVDAFLDIAKQRDGPVGEQQLIFVKELARFRNPPHKTKLYDTH
jgi:replicative DNA helicase